MPIVKQIRTDSYEVLVWKIEEAFEFFSSNLRLSNVESQEYLNITNEARKLEWLASRFVQRRLIKDSLIKDDFGKPSLDKQEGFVSIAHCKDFAAAMYSKEGPVGIDIEPIDCKVLRIAQKFLNTHELSFIASATDVQHVIAAWCVKEAVFKWYGKKSLSFKNNIQIRTFQNYSEEVKVDFNKDNIMDVKYVRVLKIENCMLAFTL